MAASLTFHARLDARGKIQVPKRSRAALGWQKGDLMNIRIMPVEEDDQHV
jgi:bifunctional DNA-binding transcriptional regulator/antitoxin component of YhaV-PrlF toxin-antitoxin module